MPHSHLSGLERRILGVISAEFPVSDAPYCELADRVGCDELELLNAVEALRETDVIARIAAEFDTAALGTLTDEERDLADLLEYDLPYGEHPYAELANILQEHGIDVEEEWVLDRLHHWIEGGAVIRFAADVES